ncbi:MAG: phage tail tape measure protein [Bacilli bacterium]|nr:phage tail tape measure protein [Bacilli bacterium]
MASSRIKGITIEIDGDTTKLGKALESAEGSSKKLQGELKGINTLLKLDPSNVELLTQKQKVLTDSISATEDKLNTLKRAQAQVQEQFDRGEITAEQFRDFQREIIVTQQRLNSLKDEMKEFGSVSEQQLKATGKKVEELGKKIEDTGSKFSGISAAAGAGLGVAITSAASLEEAVHKYLGATGKSIEETQKYQEVLQSIHNNNYGEDYVDIADKMRIVSNILGDLPQDELQSVVEKSYMLEDAYGMDFQENVRGVNALMDQFGITADQAYELINQGAQKGLNQNQDLTDQIAEYSTYYSKLGFTAEEFFNIMIAGSKDGAYQIDYLNDAMKEFGIRTKDNSTGTISALEAMGMNAQDIMNKFAQGGDTAQEAFAEVTSSLMALEDPVKRNELGVQLFGTKWEDLEENAVKAMTSAKSEVDMLGTTVDKTSETMYGGTANKAKEAMRSIQNAFAELGNALLPILAPIAEKIAELATKFSNLSPTIQKIILVIMGIAAAFAPVLIVIGKIITAVGQIMPLLAKLTPVFTFIKTAISGLFALIMAHPVIAIITAIIAIIILLWNKCDWFRNGVKALWQKIQEGLAVAFEWIKGVFSQIGELFVNIWNKAKEIWTIISSFLLSIYEWINTNLITPVVNLFKSLWDGIVLIFTPIVTWFSELFKMVWEVIESILIVIVGLFKGSLEIILAVWGVIASWFNENVVIPLSNFFTSLWEVIKAAAKLAWTFIADTWSKVSGWFNEKIIQPVSNFFSNMWTKLKNGAKDAWSGIQNVFSKVAQFFGEKFGNAWERVKSIFSTGGKIFSGITEGITSAFKKVVNAIIGGINKVVKVPFNYINTALNKIRNISFLGISPFKDKWGSNPITVPQIPTLAVGTNKVKKEGLAYLHENEAVVPEKYNPAINDEVMRNSLMDALTNFTNTKMQNTNHQYGISELTNLMKEYMPLILDNIGQDIVLDDRTLVGKITPKIDKQLGVISANKNRGW